MYPDAKINYNTIPISHQQAEINRGNFLLLLMLPNTIVNIHLMYTGVELSADSER